MSEDVKARILAAAKRLFAQKGFTATSIRQICEEAGVNVALVSYHFGGKEKLLEAVYANFFPDLSQYKVFDEIQDPLVLLQEMIKQFLLLMRRDPEVTKILLLDLNLRTEQLDYVQVHIMPFWSRLRSTIERGMEMGVFHVSSLDHALVQVAGVMVYSFHAEGVEPLLADWPPQVEDEIVERTRFILRGLGVRTEENA